MFVRKVQKPAELAQNIEKLSTTVRNVSNIIDFPY